MCGGNRDRHHTNTVRFVVNTHLSHRSPVHFRNPEVHARVAASRREPPRVILAGHVPAADAEADGVCVIAPLEETIGVVIACKTQRDERWRHP